MSHGDDVLFSVRVATSTSWTQVERMDRKALRGRRKRIRPVARDRGKGGHAVRPSRAAIWKTGEKAGTFCGLGARR
jgi:hypothetical protein